MASHYPTPHPHPRPQKELRASLPVRWIEQPELRGHAAGQAIVVDSPARVAAVKGTHLMERGAKCNRVRAYNRAALPASL